MSAPDELHAIQEASYATAVGIVERPEGAVLERWRARFERDPDWAQAWLELRPARLYSYACA